MAGERILVCDDDPQILRALRLVLRGAGYEVLTSATAEEALDRAAVGGPHAAIIDLMLPDRPGIEVCRELRSWSELPIIVLSAVTEEDAKVSALQSGADDYVTKPFAPAELVARVQAVLRRAGRAATEPTIEADGLVIDLAAHAVSLDGEEVRQMRADQNHWRTRLGRIDKEMEVEPRRIEQHYDVKVWRIEPVGLAYLWPVTG